MYEEIFCINEKIKWRDNIILIRLSQQFFYCLKPYLFVACTLRSYNRFLQDFKFLALRR